MSLLPDADMNDPEEQVKLNLSNIFDIMLYHYKSLSVRD